MGPPASSLRIFIHLGFIRFMLHGLRSSCKPSLSNMRDGQGCLLPVLRCHTAPLLLDEDPFKVVPWLLPQICCAEVVSQLPEVLSSSLSPINLAQDSVPSKTEKRKRVRKLKDSPGRSGYGGKGGIYKNEGKFSSCGHEYNLLRKTGFGLECIVSSLEVHVSPQCVGFHTSAKQLDVKVGLQSFHEADGEVKKVQGEDKTACSTNGKGGASEAQEDYTAFLPGLDDETALRCLAFVSLSDHHRLAMVAQRYRSLIRSSLLFELRRTYKVVEQWVCIYTSGDNGWMAFDPKQHVWRNLPPANVDPLFKLSDRESLSAGTHLLWLGREVFDFACYKYDLITNSWERGPPMVNSRCLFASASCGELAFVAGGFKVGGNGVISMASAVLNSAERYDARLGKWEPLPSMETPRQKCSGVFMEGKFYVIGGKDIDHNPLTSGEVYDPVTKTWKTIPNMYIPPATTPTFEPSPPLVAVANDQLYAIESSTNLLKGYNKSTNTWKALGRVPVRTDVCNGWGLAFKALGDELFVIGGYQTPTSREGVAVFSLKPRLDAAAPEWQPGAPLPDWKLVNFRARGNGSFLYNCAVMSC